MSTLRTLSLRLNQLNTRLTAQQHLQCRLVCMFCSMCCSVARWFTYVSDSDLLCVYMWCGCFNSESQHRCVECAVFVAIVRDFELRFGRGAATGSWLVDWNERQSGRRWWQSACSRKSSDHSIYKLKRPISNFINLQLRVYKAASWHECDAFLYKSVL